MTYTILYFSVIWIWKYIDDIWMIKTEIQMTIQRSTSVDLTLQGGAEVADSIGAHVAEHPEVRLGLLDGAGADADALGVADCVQQRGGVEEGEAGSIFSQPL